MSIITTALAGASSLFAILSGNSGAFVSIAGIPLTGWAMPEHVGTPGEQHMIVERLPGGQKAIQTLGYFDESITLSASFNGLGLYDAAEQLRGICQSGQIVMLVCQQITRWVVVKHFDPDMRHGWLDWRMELEVVPPPSGALSLSGPSALQSVASGDVDTSAGILGDISGLASGASVALGTILTGIVTAQIILGTSGALTGGSGVTSLSVALATSQGGVATASGLSETAIGGGNTSFASGFNSSLGPVALQASTTLTSVTAYAGTLAGVQQIGGYLARSQRNVAGAAPNAGATPTLGTIGGVAST